MKYTDKQLIRASQIAYFCINTQAIGDINEWVKSEKEVNPLFESTYTLSEFYEHSEMFRNSIYNDISKATGFTVTENDNRTDVLNRIESDVKRRSVAENTI